MSKRTLRRAYGRVAWDIIPRALAKLGYRPPPPTGRARPPSEDYSMAVPFRYAIPSKGGRPPVAVICHLFHADLAPWLLQALSPLGILADIYVSTDTAEKASAIGAALSAWPGGTVTVRIAENRGRDIAPKLITFADVYDRHERVLFLHSKKSAHYDFGEAWRDYLVQCLAGSPAIVNSILEVFDQRPEVGMVIPQHFHRLLAITAIDWASNYPMAQRLAWRMDIDLSPNGYIDLPSGSMFWARSRALKPLLDLHLGRDDFPPELGQLDMTTAHCVERLFLFTCERAGFTWVKVTEESMVAADPTVVAIDRPSEIGAFVARHRFDLLGDMGRHR